MSLLENAPHLIAVRGVSLHVNARPVCGAHIGCGLFKNKINDLFFCSAGKIKHVDWGAAVKKTGTRLRRS